MKVLAFLIALVGLVLIVALTIAAFPAAADGWRASFLVLSAPPIGAIALLLVARVVGADWDAALVPLTRATPWLVILALPVMVGQALLHWPTGHLHIWLSPPAFVLRSAIALIFWSGTAQAIVRRSSVPAGPLLLAHGLVVSVMGYDWLLGTAPAQPNSAAPMMLAVMQIGGAAALACAARLGTWEQRRDLAYLLIASALGLAYLLYIDFAIIWFGNLPSHVGWYVARTPFPEVVLPGLALAIGLLAPILLIGIGRSDPARRQAGALALTALGLVAIWAVAGPGGWFALFAAVAGVMAVGGLAKGLAS